MVKVKVKKRKLVKEATGATTTTNANLIDKKLKKKKKKLIKPDKPIVPVPTKELDPQTATASSSSDDDDDDDPSLSEPEKIQKLLEPYTKDQLVGFLIDAAVRDPSVLARVRAAADRDVSHRKIFVHGLGWDTTRETLAAAFEPFGEIEDCNVVTDHATGKAKGFGFVLFASRRGAAKALQQPRMKINNRMASCQLASTGPVPPAQGQDVAARKIYVGNVQSDVDPERLRAFFGKFGEIETGPLGFDMQTGKSRGFALFVYKTQEGARKVLEEPYKMFEGHQLHCKRAAEGKNKVVASVTTTVQPILQPPVLAAAQNLAMFNPMYGGLLANPDAAFLAAAGVNPLGLGPGVLGSSVGLGVGGYDGAALGSLGGNQSVLGAYGGGSSAPMLQGLQHAYPNSQMGQSSTTKAQGAGGGSFGGYSSFMCFAEL